MRDDLKHWNQLPFHNQFQMGKVWHFSEETIINCQHLIEAFGLTSWSALSQLE
jgi:hypothetical protein